MLSAFSLSVKALPIQDVGVLQLSNTLIGSAIYIVWCAGKTAIATLACRENCDRSSRCDKYVVQRRSLPGIPIYKF
ncbi:MAG: hypothetical protein F6J93_33090 [Oscillatoria sp. SIO1A7]|nr:hypothetical protein [Oscillatoria sp. SIO1A7]